MKFGIRLRVEGMGEVRFSDLDRLKERDLLCVGEEMDALRRHRPLTPSFPLNKVDDELRRLGTLGPEMMWP